MERVTCRQPIAEALDLLPPGLRRRVEHTDFLTGVDPVFVGLHSHATMEYADRVYSYAEIAHVSWGTTHVDHLARADRATTVVLPSRAEYDLTTVLHELGHVLDEAIGWIRHSDIVPVNWYGRADTWEAFAEAFVCYVAPDLAAVDVWSAYDLDAARADAQTIALFDELARV